MAHGSGHHRIIATRGQPFSRMTCPNASHCLFLLAPKRRIQSRKNVCGQWKPSWSAGQLTLIENQASAAPMSDAVPPMNMPFHSPNVKPIMEREAEKPNSGGWDEATVCEQMS